MRQKSYRHSQKQCHLDDPELRIIERRFYYCLLNLSRLLRPLGAENGTNRDKSLKIFLEQIQSDVKNKEMWLEKDAVATAYEFIEKIKILIEDLSTMSNKITELKKIILNITQESQSAIVLADASEVSTTESYWQGIFPNRSDVRFVSSSELDFEQDYDHLIVCGWLGADRMRKLFDSCIASSITILMYPFEQEWFRSTVSRWRKQKDRQKRDELTVQQKAKILQVQPENLPLIPSPKEGKPPVADPEPDFDITEFELRLHTYRSTFYAQTINSRRNYDRSTFCGFFSRYGIPT